MVVNKRKLQILCLLIILLLLVFTWDNNFRKFERRATPDLSLKMEEHNEFYEYILDYLDVMLPKYKFIEVPNDERSSAKIKNRSLLYSVETKEFENIYGEPVQRQDVYFSFHMNNFDYANVISNTHFPMYDDTFGHSVRDELVYDVCGDLAGNTKCFQYVDEVKGICYTVANNNGFGMSMMGFYCPDATEFDNKVDQFINYLYDGFMSLEIPEEFSSTYPKSRRQD